MKTTKRLSALFCFFLLLKLTMAQSDADYEKLKQAMWSDPDFKVTETPDKWKDESAVILAKSYEYVVKKEVFLNYVYENIYLHKRVKLLDKSAVNEFSEFSFENDYRKSYSFLSPYEIKDISVGIKVIKPSGKESIIDLKEAVLNEIKEGYNKKEFKKIAISDLEQGDIIDYFYCIKNTYVERYYKILDPVYYMLVEDYPIVQQKFNVKTLRQIYFNSKSMNGAPALKQTDKDDESSYTFVDKDREKSVSNLWAYPLRIYPVVKFQAFYIMNKVLNQLDFMRFFLSEKKTNNSNVDIAHTEVLAKKIYNTQYLFDYLATSDGKSYLKSNFDKKTPTDTLVKHLFYFYRNYMYNYNMVNAILRNTSYNRADISENTIMLAFSDVLKSRKINHDLVFTIPNYISDISNLILPVELNYLIRIKGNPDYFIGDFSSFALFKSINSSFQGNNAYAVNIPVTSNTRAQKIVIPTDKADANSEVTIVNAKFKENQMDSLEVNINRTLSGINRESSYSSLITEFKYLNTISPKQKKKEKEKEKEKPKKQSQKDLNAEKERKQRQEQQQKDSEKRLQESFKDEFGADDNFKIRSYSVNQLGLWDYKKDLVYQVSFNIGNVLKKIGANYLLEVGKVIPKQLELNKNDIDRKVDVYAPYPREFEYKISIEIPSSYRIKGIEKLNYNIVNPTGGFISKADIQNNILTINVKKYYINQFEKVTEWPKMVEFIEAAYNFTQQNILLEKI